MKIVRVMGLRRSGNHAIINWLSSNFNNGNYVNMFFNENAKMHLPVFTNYERDIFFFNSCSEDPFWGIDIDDLQLDSCKLLIHSYEDKPFSYVKEHSYNKCLNTDDDIINIIILRDPFNMCASRLNHVESDMWTKVDQEHIDLWVSYAQEALNITNDIPNKVVILYNQWVTDKQYRDSIAKMLNTYNYDSINSVSECGYGSSFVGLQLDTPDNYTHRYKQVVFPDEIIELLKSDTVLDLTKQLFPSLYYQLDLFHP